MGLKAASGSVNAIGRNISHAKRAGRFQARKKGGNASSHTASALDVDVFERLWGCDGTLPGREEKAGPNFAVTCCSIVLEESVPDQMHGQKSGVGFNFPG